MDINVPPLALISFTWEIARSLFSGTAFTNGTNNFARLDPVTTKNAASVGSSSMILTIASLAASILAPPIEPDVSQIIPNKRRLVGAVIVTPSPLVVIVMMAFTSVAPWGK